MIACSALPSSRTRAEVVPSPDAALEAELRQYVRTAAASQEVNPGHDPRWLRVLNEALRQRPLALVARREAERVPGLLQSPGPSRPAICGYLPLALVASAWFGRFLVSLPYLDRAGVLADDATVAAALLERAAELAAVHDAQYLELRHAVAVSHHSLTASRHEKVRMVLPLPAIGPGAADALWSSLEAKVRNQVRKGDKSGLSVRWGGAELVNDFYSVFAVNMRDLGTPVYPRRLFTAILERFAGEAELAVVDVEGQPIAAALLLHHAAAGRRPAWSQVPSASCLRQSSATSANMWMYHRLLLRAIERGSAEFDFGRSTVGSGTFRFKKQWGAQPRPTVWQYHVRRGDIEAARPEAHRGRVEAWQKLPVWVTRLVGPAIVRGIP